ncbi:class I SAM-dependent methyltransferase [Rhizobium sp. SAFR-030]|uniref:class I SAM-dependent methyltransferase n=1 Tax=Rhizobium sp. SAFR-030 TaxID=3387277 RepID=UPI003F81D356
MAVDDDPTDLFYASNSAAYAAHSREPNHTRLERFVAQLRENARVLELGCGNGRDSAWMIGRGLDVVPTDGTQEMAEEAARRLGVDVPVLRFADIEAVGTFGGIWANACLLHVPRPELAGILARIHRALRPGGIFYASYKAGDIDGRDGLGRYYNYPSAEELEATYATLPWASLEIIGETGSGYDRLATEWLHVWAKAK